MDAQKGVMMTETRAHLHMGICRQCWGTGMTPSAGSEAATKSICRDCHGEGALA